MRNDDTMIMFRGVVMMANGTVREINDKSPGSGETFLLDHGLIEGMAENLALWWDDDSDIPPTKEDAEAFFDRIYPEVNEED